MSPTPETGFKAGNHMVQPSRAARSLSKHRVQIHNKEESGLKHVQSFYSAPWRKHNHVSGIEE